MVHSEQDYEMAVEASSILFGNATSDSLKKLDEDTLLAVFDGVPTFEVEKEAVLGKKLMDVLTDDAAVFASKGEMRKLIQNGGFAVNKEKVADLELALEAESLLNDKYLLVQKGKKNYFLLILK